MNTTLEIYERSVAQRSMPDWHLGLSKLKDASRSQRYDAFNMRSMATQLRNETAIQTKWDTYKNNDRLRDRIFDVDMWRDELRATLDRVEQEMFSLGVEKINTERCMDALQTPFAVITECLSNRDTRRITETTHDYLGEELKRELLVAETNKQHLVNVCCDAWEKLSYLEAIKRRLQNEISNKENTLQLEEEQLNMDKNSAMISYKMEPFRVLQNSITEDGWLDFTKDTINLANSIMAESKFLREKMFQAREKCANELNAQKQVVEHGLRKRIFETQRAKNELEWQRMKMKDSMYKTALEVAALQDALEAKVNVEKLAETRAENRTYRPRLELVRDRVVDGLEEESKHVRQTMAHLHNKINQMKATFNSSEKLLFNLEKELDDKGNTLEIDKRCIEIRAPLAISYRTPTQQNVDLVKITRNQLPI